MTPNRPRPKSTRHVVRCSDGRYKALRLTQKTAIACMCTECLGWGDNPSLCTSFQCPLYPWRAKTLQTKRGNLDKPVQDSAL